MMFKFYLLCFPLVFASWFSFFGGSTDPYEKKRALMDRLISRTEKELNKRYKLVPFGRGGSVKEEKASLEYVAFQLYHKLTKEEARALIVQVVELFLQQINNNQEIADFLYNRPFTYRNLEIEIFINNSDRSDIFHPDLGVVSLSRRGTVNFITYEPGNKFCKYATDVEEPYEETYRMVKQRFTNGHQAHKN